MNSKIVKLNSDEIQLILDVLIEVCHGIRIDDFEQTIGAKKTSAIDLMDRIFGERDKDELALNLNENELMILKKSFVEVFRQIEEWEFQTLMGMTIPKAKKIQDKL